MKPFLPADTRTSTSGLLSQKSGTRHSGGAAAVPAGGPESSQKILEGVPEDINLEKIYGIKYVPALPIVEMAVKKASFSSRK